MTSNSTERQPAVELPDVPNGRIASPCVRNCCLNEQDICVGCGRTMGEIIEWTAVDDLRRRSICAAAAARLAARVAPGSSAHDLPWQPCA